MKLSEFRGEDAIDVLAEIIVPATEIINDAGIKKDWNNGADFATCLIIALKEHKDAVITILATMEQKPKEEFLKDVTIFTIPAKLVDLIGDEALVNFLLPVPTMKGTGASGDATAPIKEKA